MAAVSTYTGAMEHKPEKGALDSLSHVDERGAARMVDVGGKPVVARVARAEGFVRVSAALARAIAENAVAKGDVLTVARIAGIMAAKRTDELIPLCHTLPVDVVNVELRLEEFEVGAARPATVGVAGSAGGAGELRGWRVRIEAEARVAAKTGVEMEALTAVCVAALTVVDMGKAIDKRMVIEGIRVTGKKKG
ncbi:cyclic pyranopterin monophosphate synthase MoaC [soil metagenome]